MKKIFILICVAALLFALCACTDQKQEETVTTGTTQSTDPAGNKQTSEPNKDTSEPTADTEDTAEVGGDDSDGWSKVY